MLKRNLTCECSQYHSIVELLDSLNFNTDFLY